MTLLYLSEDSIKAANSVLNELNYKHANELFSLLILKYSGLNQHEYLDLSKEETKESLLKAAIGLSYLYVSKEYLKEKLNFINPLNMDEWGKNPKESIHLWATQRLINNVTGGGRQWKSILVSDSDNANIVKLKHNYLDFFKNHLTKKVSLDALSIWFNKFTPFTKEEPISKLIAEFNQAFNITEEEKSVLFSTNNVSEIQYTIERVDSSYIRNLIGNPKNEANWVERNVERDLNIAEELDLFSSKVNTTFINISKSKLDEQYYFNLLDNANQIILMGPPGTSKSYLAKKISKKFNKTKRVQFHPQYSYQDFIGGKILENGTLKDNKGEFITFIEEAMEPENKHLKYLLVIEEINRANVSQVFGEIIQLLDRDEKLSLTFNNITAEYRLPSNLKIIGTMNTTDRTVGRIDYALKRRFYQIYCPPEINVLIDNVKVEGNEFSVGDLLLKINRNLVATLNNKEMVIGHAIFLKDFVYDDNQKKYVWSVEEFEGLFNYVVVPIVEDYCNGNVDLILNVLGEKLYQNHFGGEFVVAVKEFLS